ncbi:MAG: oxygenase MpaB family protein, partial [Actinomycetota bacterium]|nr:oxygenase MpaB family protein [Actinomycetota bacterium]
DRYVAESGSIATRLGADPVPTTEQGVAHLLNDFRSELRATPEAKEAARYLLINPPLPASSKPAYGLIAAAGASLLPLWARKELRIPWLPVSERLAIRPAGDLITKTIRWALQPGQPSA